MRSFNITRSLFIVIIIFSLAITVATESFFANQTDNPRLRWYFCPDSSRWISFQQLIDTISIGITSIYNNAEFSGITTGSRVYPHIFDTTRLDTPWQIRGAITASDCQLTSHNSIQNWQTALNIISYPILPETTSSSWRPEPIYWQPSENTQPGEFRLLAERDPASPFDWRLCAIIAHLKRPRKGFELCREEFRPFEDFIDKIDHVASMTPPGPQERENISIVPAPRLTTESWGAID